MKHSTNYRLKIVQGIGWGLAIYLFVNLTLYVLGMVSHLLFWGSLLLIFAYNVVLLPRLRQVAEEIEQSKKR